MCVCVCNSEVLHIPHNGRWTSMCMCVIFRYFLLTYETFSLSRTILKQSQPLIAVIVTEFICSDGSIVYI